MKKCLFALPLPLLLGLLPPPVLANTLYKCQDASGRTTYTNQKTQQKCEIISQDLPVSSFTPPKARQATPADFPRVNENQQRARDNDRRAILEQELGNEQNNLDAARKTLAEQEGMILPEERIAGGGVKGSQKEARVQGYRDKLHLHERNIESIRKEISNLR